MADQRAPRRGGRRNRKGSASASAPARGSAASQPSYGEIRVAPRAGSSTKPQAQPSAAAAGQQAPQQQQAVQAADRRPAPKSRELYDPNAGQTGSASSRGSQGSSRPTATAAPAAAPRIARAPSGQSVSTAPAQQQQPEPALIKQREIDPADLPPSVKLLDDRMRFTDKARLLLSEQNSHYLVVGVIGAQGVGKSSILNILYGGDTIFPPGQSCVSHETVGVDLAVTSDRLILLDCQPLNSASMLDRLLRSEAPIPSTLKTHEQALEVESLQLAMFLQSVCHVLLVVQDASMDLCFLKFLSDLDMLRPVVEHSDAPRGYSSKGAKSGPDPPFALAEPIFVFNKLSPEDLHGTTRQRRCEMVNSILGRSASFVRPPGKGEDGQHVGGQRAAPGPQLFFVNRSRLDGTVPATFVELRQHILGKTRHQLVSGKVASSERDWLVFASKVWQRVAKASVLHEFAFSMK